MPSDEEAEVIPVPEKLGYSQSKVIQFNYTWMIENYDHYDRSYESPIFSPGCNGKLKWCLKWYEAEACLCLLPCNISEMTVNYKISLLNGNGKKAIISRPTSICKSVSSTEITEYKAGTIFNYDGIYSGVNAVLPDGNLTIFCEIELVVNVFNIPGNTTVIKVPERQLNDNMGLLLKGKKFSDVTINVGGQEMPAHKAILSVRSRVFSAMFEHEMAEKQQNRVDITDVELEVFRELLRYIYTDQVPNIETMADKLLMAAEKYELERLKLMCEEQLRANLTIENAADTLILADLQHADQLKAQAVDFIALNMTEVMETESFKSMVNSHRSLIFDVLQASAMRKSSGPDESMLHLL